MRSDRVLLPKTCSRIFEMLQAASYTQRKTALQSSTRISTTIAAFADALADLYQATGETKWLEESLRLADEMRRAVR